MFSFTNPPVLQSSALHTLLEIVKQKQETAEEISQLLQQLQQSRDHKNISLDSRNTSALWQRWEKSSDYEFANDLELYVCLLLLWWNPLVSYLAQKHSLTLFVECEQTM